MVGGGLIDAAAAASLLEARASSFFSLWFNKAIFLKNEKEKESKKKGGWLKLTLCCNFSTLFLYSTILFFFAASILGLGSSSITHFHSEQLYIPIAPWSEASLDMGKK